MKFNHQSYYFHVFLRAGGGGGERGVSDQNKIQQMLNILCFFLVWRISSRRTTKERSITNRFKYLGKPQKSYFLNGKRGGGGEGV